MSPRQPMLRRSPRLHPLRRSPRLAAASASAAVAKSKQPKKRATVRHVVPMPLLHETKEPNVPPSSPEVIDGMTEEEFNRFNDALSDEDKELQASLLMWCIMRSIPYTLDLFREYKRNVEEIRAMGLF